MATLSLSMPHFIGGGFDRRHDVSVARASADLPAELFLDQLLAGLRVTPDDIARHHEHPRRAEAALYGMFFVEVTSDDIHRTIGARALDGFNLATVRHDGQDDAGSHCDTVHRNCAGTASAMFAAGMTAGQVEMLAQDVEQTFARLDLPGNRYAVHVQNDGVHDGLASAIARDTVAT
jgi:hypothetical protein